MPAGWRRPGGFLLTVVLVVSGCAPSASPTASHSSFPRATASPSPSPSPSPSRTPRPTPTPIALSCFAGNRAPVGEPEIIAIAPNAGPAMALTFDMGGRLDPAIDILDFLIANQVCATLFPTGAMSETVVGQELLAIVRANPDLFELGNHTMHHCNLRDGGLGSPTEAPCATGGPPTAAFISAELTDAAAIVETATGQPTVPYWRPPYGVYNDTVLATAAELGYTKTIMWSIDTLDWRPIVDGGPTAEQIASDVVTSASSGAIVLMHLGGYETLAALEIMVPALRERGLLLTSISDLLD